MYPLKCGVVQEYTTFNNGKGCVSENVYNTSCSGYCESNATTVTFNSTTILRDCYCCRPKTMQLRVSIMTCADGSMKLYYYAVISSCICSKCGTNPIGTTEENVFTAIVHGNT